jgi:hypothetical protein
MSNTQDINSKAQAEPGESHNDVAQTKISSTEKDALSEGSLDGVSGGTLVVFNTSCINHGATTQSSTGPSG